MVHRSSRALLMAIACLLGACGGSASSPASPTPLTSPTFRLTGTVTGFEGVSLAGAVVEVLDGADKGHRAVADPSGKYVFSALGRGAFTLLASANLYAPATKTASLSGDMSVDVQMQAVPAKFQLVGTKVVPLPGRPDGTYGGEIVSSGDGCAFRLLATARFVDRNSQVLATLSWSAPPATIFRPGDRPAFEFCCITREQAAVASDVVNLSFNWTNLPCS